MKRQILTIAMMLALVAGGAAFAQYPQEQKPAPVAPETEQGEGMDVDVDTGARAEGAVDVDVNSTTDADTDASGVDETLTGTAEDSDDLPATASEVPALGLLGLLALAGAVVIRARRRA